MVTMFLPFHLEDQSHAGGNSISIGDYGAATTGAGSTGLLRTGQLQPLSQGFQQSLGGRNITRAVPR
jgi:hypothetical protein